jgi:polar amino acid transport system permease protein
VAGFDWRAFAGYLPNAYLLEGAVTTVWLTMAAIVGGFLLGLVVAIAGASRLAPVASAARFYVWIFRGTPLLIQLIVIYTGLPRLGIRFDVVQSALLGLILNEAAYLSEIIRAGFLGVPRGQVEAARSLGLSDTHTLRFVTMPQAMRLIVPPLGNSVNSLLKATSVTSVISMEELLRRGQVLIQLRFEVLEIFAVCGVYYLILTSAWGAIQKRIEARYGRAYEQAAGVRRDHN